MTETDLQSSAPPPQSAQTAAANSSVAAASGPVPAFRLPAHGPAYQAMHAMLQRRREELAKVQAEGGGAAGAAGMPGGSVGAFTLGPPSVSLPHMGMVVAAGGAKGGSAAPEPLQPMLSF